MMSDFNDKHPHIARHDMGPLEDWRASLNNVIRRRAVILDRTPLASDGTELLECDLDIAALSSLFADASENIAQSFARGAGAGAAASLCNSEDDGAVLLDEPGQATRQLPNGAASLNPALWRDAFALACAARDRDALALLCAPARIDSCQLPADRADAFWLPYCRALAAIVSAPQDFAHQEQAARALMNEARIASASVVSQLDRPLLDLAQALLAQDTSNWNAALVRALEQHGDYYAAESHRFDRRGFLAFGITGLCALAHDSGIETNVESPYLPLSLVRGSSTGKLSLVTYLYPPRTIVRSEEAHWLLDLRGFPRATRSHRLLEEGQHLLARYDAHGALDLPHARIDFVLADDEAQARNGDDARALPARALDAGELLWLAQVFAEEAGSAPLPARERRALLSEAVECVEVALERIAPGENAVPATSLTSERGRQLYETEPGRFQRERMTAYRDALASHLDKLDAQLAQDVESNRVAPHETDGTDAHRASDVEADVQPQVIADAAIELIRAQVAPLLEALARDRTGEVVKLFRPRADDYAKVFVGEAVDVARQSYESVWGGSLNMAYPSAQQTVLRCHVAPAGMLAEDNELSRHFPGGYRSIARWLNPHRVWVAWKYLRPGEGAGLSYDGLVWIDDHWAWFPKPYRILKLPSG